MNVSSALNLLAERVPQICQQTFQQMERLRINLHVESEAKLLDFGVQHPGSLAGGLKLAEICLGGLAEVSVLPQYDSQLPLPAVSVWTDWPLMGCIGSQYAGWPFSQGDYFAMCSGPARINRGQEAILKQYRLAGNLTPAVGVFESSRLPGIDEVAAFAEACQIKPEQALICVARTASLPGMVQVVARSIETAMHKLHELEFDLSQVVAGSGMAPLPPLVSDDLVALGWTNDAILYGGCVNLWLDTSDAAIERVLDQLPSSSSADFGVPFLQIFQRYNHDFYKIDKLLFSPARILLNNLKTGRVFSCGKIHHEILKQSFGLDLDSINGKSSGC